MQVVLRGAVVFDIDGADKFPHVGKTEAAIVVASQLNAETAEKITSVAGLLNHFTGRDLL